MYEANVHVTMLCSVVHVRVVYNNSRRQTGKKLTGKRDSTRTDTSAGATSSSGGDRKRRVSFDERVKSFFLSEVRSGKRCVE